MSKAHIKYPSIDHTKNFLKNAKRNHPETREVLLEGTVKIHGTNAGIVYWADEEVTVQSRNNVISTYYDNAGFAAYVDHIGAEEIFTPPQDGSNYVVFGEWCGGNIQKGVSISGMDKKFIVFDVYEFTTEDGEGKTPLSFERYSNYLNEEVLTVRDFETYSFLANLYDPENLWEKLDSVTDQVEKDCPVGKTLNPCSENTVGEGVVWRGYVDGRYVGKFKHKGVEHQRSHGHRQIKTENPLHVAMMEEFSRVALTEDRLLQGLEVVKETDPDLTMKSMGNYLKWVNQDIQRECRFEIEDIEREYEIHWKKLSRKVSEVARNFYMQNC